MATVPKYVLHYFNFAGRAESIRLALAIAGVPFEDRRIDFPDWPAIKSSDLTPYGVLPVLEVKRDGKSTTIAESTAILGYITAAHGADCGMQRSDPLEAARVEEIRSATDMIMFKVAASMSEKDEDKKREQRKELAEATLPKHLAAIDARLQPNGYASGNSITTADLVLACSVAWLQRGVLDGIPTTIADPYERIIQSCANVAEHPRVKDWNQSHQ